LLYDGALRELAERLAPFKLIRVAVGNGAARAEVDVPHGLDLPPGVDVVERTNGHLTLRVTRAQAPAMTAQLLNALPVADLSVEDPPIEAVIDQVYQRTDLVRQTEANVGGEE
jgi:ABC-2 type transport system ATP-binding protein